ncbi:MAG: CPBP family intramembrane metalloprotease [Limimaricola sp.]|uniref:CPBP family intramembrane glutamic endopeptidase n=1 Tax=Limimaricola sp. TaxID=2211665 RepID=UPI001DB800B6|nr:CPBP family intramembrane glutamic endopeptidase [Limimaricola sp.]MBI1418536.1 CPBP family intramembrane metalloprotease [Limimaricola sp.]
MSARGQAAAGAAAIVAGWAGLTLAVYYAVAAIMPGWDYARVSTVTLVVLALVLVVWLGRDDGWRRCGFADGLRASDAGLVGLAALIALAPLAAGVRWPGAADLAVMIVGYALTGFVEEALFRGLLIERLRPRGARFAVVVSAVLFGLLHLVNIAFRGQVAPILAQMVGVACFGIGYGALRLRIGTIWPLIVLHMLTDLCLHLGRWPVIPVAVVQDTLLLILGLWLMRAGVSRGSAPPRAP